MLLIALCVLAGLAFGWAVAFWLCVGLILLWGIVEGLDL